MNQAIRQQVMNNKKALKTITLWRVLLFVTSACITVSTSAAPAQNHRELYKQIPTVVVNTSGTTFDLQAYNLHGDIAASTTLVALAVDSFSIPPGEVRIYKTSRKSLFAGRPIASCRVPDAKTDKAFFDKETHQIFFEIARNTIRPVLPREGQALVR